MNFQEIILGEDGDAGEFWIAQAFTYRNTETRFVFCLGGSSVFLGALLQAGFRVVVMDRDISALMIIYACRGVWHADYLMRRQ